MLYYLATDLVPAILVGLALCSSPAPMPAKPHSVEALLKYKRPIPRKSPSLWSLLTRRHEGFNFMLRYSQSGPLEFVTTAGLRVMVCKPYSVDRMDNARESVLEVWTSDEFLKPAEVQAQLDRF